jgi:uncharacterized lipoprotein YmbA
MRLRCKRALAAVAFAGCSILTAKPDRTRFYVLDVTSPSTYRVPPAATPLIGLGPITLPSYLDRPELVTRMGGNELKVSQTGRWAEPLDRGFARALREKLESRLGPDAVVPFPWELAKAPPLAIAIDVQRFEQVGEAAELWARFSVREVATAHIVFAGEERLREPLADATPEAAVASLSRALAAFGRKLVPVIVSRLPPGRPG